MQYNQDLSNYYKDIKEYRRLKDKLGQVEAHITRTIQQDLLYHIKDKSNAYEAAKTLHARRSNIEDWCSEFLTV
jgi:hypothetical protein